MKVECKDLAIWINKTTTLAQKNDVLVSIIKDSLNNKENEDRRVDIKIISIYFAATTLFACLWLINRGAFLSYEDW